MSFLAACQDDPVIPDTGDAAEGSLIKFVVGISNYTDTRGVDDESKKSFEVGELLHIRAVFDCSRSGKDSIEVQYGVIKYAGKGNWTAYDSEHAMYWPDEAVSASFTAYYLHGSNGILTNNTMEAKLLSDYNYGEDPLYGEIRDISYGTTVRLEMYHIFAHLTLTELNSNVPGELWFAVPESLRMKNDVDPDLDEPELNNAFYLDFDEKTKEMTPVFTKLPSTYKDEKGKNIVYILGNAEQYDNEEGHVMTRVNYFLEPRVYHRFSLLYSRSHTEYSSYLSYTRNLINMTGQEGLVANGTYQFSVLKSLGVMVEEEPDDNWDEKDPVYVIDVEEFLKAAANGQDYWEKSLNSEDRVQILESTMTGTRLLENIDLHYEFYNDVFSDGYVPNLSNTFDGNYHYIYNAGSPLFYQNQGNIINLGIRDAKITEIESNENYTLPGLSGTYDTSYNGIISCRNQGIVRNIRINNAEMNVRVKTSDPDEPTQEAHNMALLFGVNNGTVSNISFAGDFKIVVNNAEGEEIMPNVMIGGIAGQNLGSISVIGTIDGDDFRSPEISIVNKCQGSNGVYLIGGVAGINPGILDNIYIPAVNIDGKESRGVESRMGGIVGEIPNSNTGSPQISGCIVRGSVAAGEVNSLTNVNSLTYTGGVAGSLNLQGIILNNSVSVSVEGSSYTDGKVIYATGGSFGRIEKSAGTFDGYINKLASFGSYLKGVSEYIGNFAGIVPNGYGWNYYADDEITVRQVVDNNIGIEM